MDTNLDNCGFGQCLIIYVLLLFMFYVHFKEWTSNKKMLDLVVCFTFFF